MVFRFSSLPFSFSKVYRKKLHWRQNAWCASIKHYMRRIKTDLLNTCIFHLFFCFMPHFRINLFGGFLALSITCTLHRLARSRARIFFLIPMNGIFASHFASNFSRFLSACVCVCVCVAKITEIPLPYRTNYRLPYYIAKNNNQRAISIVLHSIWRVNNTNDELFLSTPLRKQIWNRLRHKWLQPLFCWFLFDFFSILFDRICGQRQYLHFMI